MKQKKSSNGGSSSSSITFIVFVTLLQRTCLRFDDHYDYNYYYTEIRRSILKSSKIHLSLANDNITELYRPIMKPESKIKLDQAHLFYRFSLGVRVTIGFGNDKVLEHYGAFSYYKHSMESKELELTREQEKLGAYLQELVGTYLMMVQLDSVLKDEWGKTEIRCYHPDIEKQNISRVVFMIRNAFAHDPFDPVWNICDPTWQKEYKITDKTTMTDILTINAKDLNGKKLIRPREKEVKIDRKEDSKEIADKTLKVFEYANDYEGQIALLRLLEYVREKIL
jgi:hypothetical protein